jgi:hypothetical protein
VTIGECTGVKVEGDRSRWCSVRQKKPRPGWGHK